MAEASRRAARSAAKAASRTRCSSSRPPSAPVCALWRRQRDDDRLPVGFVAEEARSLSTMRPREASRAPGARGHGAATFSIEDRDRLALPSSRTAASGARSPSGGLVSASTSAQSGRRQLTNSDMRRPGPAASPPAATDGPGALSSNAVPVRRMALLTEFEGLVAIRPAMSRRPARSAAQSPRRAACPAGGRRRRRACRCGRGRVPSRPRREGRLRRPGELRPVRRREHADDAQHDQREGRPTAKTQLQLQNSPAT